MQSPQQSFFKKRKTVIQMSDSSSSSSVAPLPNHITQQMNRSKARHFALPAREQVQDAISEATTLLCLVTGMMGMFLKYRFLVCACVVLALT
jgi:hypothetical protein